jgi:hypothetical protein
MNISRIGKKKRISKGTEYYFEKEIHKNPTKLKIM